MTGSFASEKHPRDNGGKFTHKTQGAPVTSLSSPEEIDRDQYGIVIEGDDGYGLYPKDQPFARLDTDGDHFDLGNKLLEHGYGVLRTGWEEAAFDGDTETATRYEESMRKLGRIHNILNRVQKPSEWDMDDEVFDLFHDEIDYAIEDVENADGLRVHWDYEQNSLSVSLEDKWDDKPYAS